MSPLPPGFEEDLTVVQVFTNYIQNACFVKK